MFANGKLVDLFHPDLSVAGILKTIDLDLDTMTKSGDFYIYDFTVPDEIKIPLLYVLPNKPEEVAQCFENISGNNWRLTMYPQVYYGNHQMGMLYGTGIAIITYTKFKLFIGGYRG